MEYKDDIPVSHCLECGDEIAYGKRCDCKFCSDSCKNRWHNRNAQGMRHYREKCDRVLEKNHRILSELIEQGVTTLELPELLSKGFKPEYATTALRGRTSLLMSCYDIHYRMTGQKIFSIGRMERRTTPKRVWRIADK